jgi:hypothetical protein
LPDRLIEFWPDTKTYGIMVHDGGSSMIVIAHPRGAARSYPSKLIDG